MRSKHASFFWNYHILPEEPIFDPSLTFVVSRKIFSAWMLIGLAVLFINRWPIHDQLYTYVYLTQLVKKKCVNLTFWFHVCACSLQCAYFYCLITCNLHIAFISDCWCVVMWSDIICYAGWGLSIWGPWWTKRLQEDNTGTSFIRHYYNLRS